MGIRSRASNIIPTALLLVVACSFLLSDQVLAGNDDMSGQRDMSQSSSQQKMTDKKKDMDKAGKTMTEGSKKMLTIKKVIAKDEKTKQPIQTMKDETKKMSGDMNRTGKKKDMKNSKEKMMDERSMTKQK